MWYMLLTKPVYFSAILLLVRRGEERRGEERRGEERRGEERRGEERRGEERRGEERRGEESAYRFFLVGLGSLDLLVEAVDLVLEVLHVLLVFLLLLQHIFQTPLLLLAELLVLCGTSGFIVQVNFQFSNL